MTKCRTCNADPYPALLLDDQCDACRWREAKASVDALTLERDRLQAQINKGLDYEHHSSCGHV